MMQPRPAAFTSLIPRSIPHPRHTPLTPTLSTMSLQQLSKNLVFGGSLTKYKIDKTETLGGLAAQFNIFLPKQAEQAKVPVLYYLAGLTCNEDTGAQKGGFIRDAAAEGIAMVFPDTSPRGAGIEGEEDDWDFGTGAGFYLDASAEKWKEHYNMQVDRSVCGSSVCG